MKYAIYTLCDDNFTVPTSVMIYSFLTNNKWFNGDIVVLYDILSYKNKNKLKMLYDNIIFKQINHNDYKDIIENVKGVSENGYLKCYYKYEIFKNQSYDVVIWIDGDIVFNASVEELFNDETVDFCWCEDKISLGQPIYFNAGFFFFRNNDNVKNNVFYNEAVNFSKNIKNVTFKNEKSFKGLLAEQDVLNELVPLYFNNIKEERALTYNFPQQIRNIELVNQAKVIHYCGGDKPFSEKIKNNYISHCVWYFYYYQLNR